jgi:hypothetical protein
VRLFRLHLTDKVIREGFVLQKQGFYLPKKLGTNSKSCDREIYVILQDFLDKALRIVHESSILDESRARLLVFQDSKIRSKKNNAYNDFL